MSITSPMRASILKSRPSTSRRSGRANDPVLRATAIVALLGIGAIHFLQIVVTFQFMPILGVAYTLLIVACLTIIGRLCVNGGDKLTWLATAGVGAAAIGGYIFTRVLSTPLDNQDVGNWACMLGLAALFIEGSLMTLSLYTAATERIHDNRKTPAKVAA
jgi:drug/metabolite transporter (DMT)-like permease